MGFEITTYYYEPGCAYAGVWKDGVEERYELHLYSREEDKNKLPEHLDKLFLINRRWFREEVEEESEKTTE